MMLGDGAAEPNPYYEATTTTAILVFPFPWKNEKLMECFLLVGTAKQAAKDEQQACGVHSTHYSYVRVLIIQLAQHCEVRTDTVLVSTVYFNAAKTICSCRCKSATRSTVYEPDNVYLFQYCYMNSRGTVHHWQNEIWLSELLACRSTSTCQYFATVFLVSELAPVPSTPALFAIQKWDSLTSFRAPNLITPRIAICIWFMFCGKQRRATLQWQVASCMHTAEGSHDASTDSTSDVWPEPKAGQAATVNPNASPHLALKRACLFLL
jgi:hypothetical protein